MERGSEKERRNKICDKDGEAGGRGLGDVDQVRREKARVIRPTPINICIGNRKVIRSCAVADVFGAFVGGKKFRSSRAGSLGSLLRSISALLEVLLKAKARRMLNTATSKRTL